uniref:Leucine-rich repeat protein n=1 Tax=Bursaphelenchus xylophilus TaxID=6326 RepID=A0A1I7RXB6_BURXY
MLTKLAVLILLCYLSNGEKVKSSSSSSESDESSKEVPVQKFIWPEACTFDGIAKVASCKPTKDQGVGTTLYALGFSNYPVTKASFMCFRPLDDIEIDPPASIEWMDTFNCGITSIKIGVEGKTYPSLTYLSLRYNLLSVVPYLGRLPNLKRLILRENQIRNVWMNSFTNNEKLEVLDLAHNEIKRIQDGAFERKVDQIILEGNDDLICSPTYVNFLRYVVKYRVQIVFSKWNKMCEK